jgi:hypothetical protein
MENPQEEVRSRSAHDAVSTYRDASEMIHFHFHYHAATSCPPAARPTWPSLLLEYVPLAITIFDAVSRFW